MYRVTHTFGIIVEFIHPDTHKCFVILCIPCIRIVSIVSGNELDVCFLGNFDHLLINKELIGYSVTHDLHIKIIPKNLLVFQCYPFGFVISPCPVFDITLIGKIKMPIHFPLQTRRSTDNPLTILT